MKLIVISSPVSLPNESLVLTMILKEGVDYLHIRKPEADLSLVRDLLDSIPNEFHSKIKLHYYQELLNDYPEIGFHHSSKTDFDSSINREQSKSFHTFEEVELSQYNYEYCFLSPVFPSISKQGYIPHYSLREFESFLKGYKNQRIVALGGVNEQNCKKIGQIGFAGVAVMGELWNEKNTDSILKKIVSIKKQLTL